MYLAVYFVFSLFICQQDPDIKDLPDMSKEELTELAQRARELTDGKRF